MDLGSKLRYILNFWREFVSGQKLQTDEEIRAFLVDSDGDLSSGDEKESHGMNNSTSGEDSGD